MTDVPVVTRWLRAQSDPFLQNLDTTEHPVSDKLGKVGELMYKQVISWVFPKVKGKQSKFKLFIENKDRVLMDLNLGTEIKNCYLNKPFNILK